MAVKRAAGEKRRSDRLVDHLGQLALADGADLGGLDLAVLEHHQGGDAAHAVGAGGLLVVVDVDLHDAQLPWYWPASSSRIGAMALHGPHHSAQKSSSTGVSDCSTSCSKASSLTWVIRSLNGVSERRVEGRFGDHAASIGYTGVPMKRGSNRERGVLAIAARNLIAT